MPDTIEQIYNNVGMEFENLIRLKIMSNVPPPNEPSTIKAKGSSHTLIDTGTMMDSVTHEVRANGDNVEVVAGIFDEDVAIIAAAQEYGISWDNRPNKSTKEEEGKSERAWFIPPRSFVRSTFDESIDSVMGTLESQLYDFAKNKLSEK